MLHDDIATNFDGTWWRSLSLVCWSFHTFIVRMNKRFTGEVNAFRELVDHHFTSNRYSLHQQVSQIQCKLTRNYEHISQDETIALHRELAALFTDVRCTDLMLTNIGILNCVVHPDTFDEDGFGATLASYASLEEVMICVPSDEHMIMEEQQYVTRFTSFYVRLFGSLSTLNNLTSLTLDFSTEYNRFVNHDARHFFTQLARLTCVESLFIGAGVDDDHFMEEYAHYIAKQVSLRKICSMDLPGIGGLMLETLLQHHTSLLHIDIVVEKLICINMPLRSLRLATRTDSAPYEYLWVSDNLALREQILQSFNNVEQLDLGENECVPNSDIAYIINHCPAIKSLGCKLYDNENLGLVVNALASNTTLLQFRICTFNQDREGARIKKKIMPTILNHPSIIFKSLHYQFP
ncbi:hypothetical protein SAMD00019534_068790 [Acytostelium subglobosum LB1]|uniref:hypothetical protein n=1 Tax=Acytostelium subglobosum LB1 TaxID=1410327 RepID=UPI000644AD61|nr:hypothetical protein SAMD00019534_068790 [Acytostelium subglobosum LB1]GAM23704.1 hypothetical protein SAMD00019534_068790 [Acytostelium subglobosum LB1]|eukprot:XP_012753445.1 hypothetical protein SAMD00019534_068790 [Acytostelium subglobosum LB1]